MPTETAFDALPNELLFEIKGHLNESDIRSLASASKRMHELFISKRLLDKFLQRVAYGEQDKVEKLFTDVYQGNDVKIQKVLLHQGVFTDYSGRIFNCSAYEYAYWAKDTHMCRMLQHYMDDATKAEMLACVTKIEHTGLPYTQHGVDYCTQNFDLKPLIQALEFYVNNYAAWDTASNWAAMKAAWMQVGLAQRDVPAHVAQEYCRPDRAFHPCPPFNETALPRSLTFHSWINLKTESWFPLTSPNSGLGFDFALIRGRGEGSLLDGTAYTPQRAYSAETRRMNLAAVSRLDEVRTVELTQLRKHLNPPPMSQCILS